MEGGVKQNIKRIRKISGNFENNFRKSKKRSLDEGGEEDQQKIKRKKMIDRSGEGAMEINKAVIQVGEESRKDEDKNNHTLVWGIKPEIYSSGQSENFGATWGEQPSNHQNEFNSATCN